MKVIASTGGTFLVEMTDTEIARAAGYPSSYDDKFVRVTNRYSPRDPLAIGTEIKVAAAYDYHSRVAQHQDAARKSAGTLRALADLLDGSMPDVVIPPAIEEPKPEPSGDAVL